MQSSPARVSSSLFTSLLVVRSLNSVDFFPSRMITTFNLVDTFVLLSHKVNMFFLICWSLTCLQPDMTGGWDSFYNSLHPAISSAYHLSHCCHLLPMLSSVPWVLESFEQQELCAKRQDCLGTIQLAWLIVMMGGLNREGESPYQGTGMGHC